MELREVAERILFGDSLEEKLRAPETITDDRPGQAIPTPQAPCRPEGLLFKPGGSGKSDFPGAHRLDRANERGRVLHFFANHELLATELMALVLLKFPEAPKAFRRGILKTLQDEQRHTRLYLDRMRECGVVFGELPVSGFFWKCVSGMESPMDYVAGLSLTFEQANLDFCRQFAQRFQQAGDAETARILGHIYEDEISHVAYGLSWFRRWKDPQQSDWRAFCQQLKFPLSPRRAKGEWINVEGRRKAGFDDPFIAALKVYSMSKGRTPDVHLFNPFEELRIEAGAGFCPARAQREFMDDLAALPMFLCRSDDVVLVPRAPAVSFLETLKSVGFDLPEFVEMPDWTLARDHPLTQRKLGRLRPWSWGPGATALLGPLKQCVSEMFREPAEPFSSGRALLFSKAWSAGFLRELLEDGGRIATPDPASWLCGGEVVGVAVLSMDEALRVIGEFRERGQHRLVAKAAFGFAGQNTARLWEPALLETQRRWMEHAMSRGHPLVIEPWLDRVADFSVQFEMGSKGLEKRGYIGLMSDHRGQFVANWAAPDFATRPPRPVLTAMDSLRDAGGTLARLYQRIAEPLQARLAAAGYTGPVGLDAFVYRDGQGGMKLKPLVEINPRYTMGRLVIELMRLVAPGSTGIFKLAGRADLKRAGSNSFTELASRWREKRVPRHAGSPKPKIVEGTFCLTDAEQARRSVALLEVSEEPFDPAAIGLDDGNTLEGA